MPSIAVVILNWNGLRFLKQFLPSVIENSQNATIYVVDNNSSDGSISFLKSHFPSVHIIENEQNLGFCGGYNAGLQKINADYYVLLNNDVEVTKDWLYPILQLENKNKIAIAQSKILDFNNKNKFEYAGASGGYLDNLGYPFCRGRIFETLENDNGQYDNPVKIAWATGACMFIKSAVFWELNGFDEDFFAHMEEIDLCWRAQHKGYEIWCFPQSVVYHVGGGTLQKSNPKKTYLNYRNGLFLLHKNLPQKYFILIIFLRLVFDGIAGLKLVFQLDFQNVISIIKAHFAYYFSISKLNNKRLFNTKKISILGKRNVVLDYFILGKKTIQ